MHRSSLRALRPLSAVSQTGQRCFACHGVRRISTKPPATPVSSTPQRRLPTTTARATLASVTKPSAQRASDIPAETPTLDPQAAIPPRATVDDADASPAKSGNGFGDAFTPSPNGSNGATIDWSSSFHGLATAPFPPETNAILLRPLNQRDVEIKPDGILYLPEIKYRRILNEAFGPGGWGLAPRGELAVSEKVVTREYALVVQGRFIAQARGECAYFSAETIPTAGEGCKSNALLRCCKDLGIASELWDPRYIRDFKAQQCHEVWVEHTVNKKRRQIWLRKGDAPVYPYTAVKK